jgi:aspartate ammonia-lyase
MAITPPVPTTSVPSLGSAESQIMGDENSPRADYVAAIDGAIDTRIEADSLGEVPVPSTAYWGVHTARALENFPITRRAIYNYPDLIRALARVKQAAARANL